MSRDVFALLACLALSGVQFAGADAASEEEGPTHPGYRVARLQKITPGIFPQWSPDGGEIAFTRQENETFEVYVMRPDGSDQRCLTCGRSALPEGGFRGQPSWHPSGDYLCFGAENTDFPRKGTGGTARPGIGRNNNIWLMTRDGSRFWKMTDYAENWGVMRCSFSRDGTKLFWNEEFSMEKYPGGPKPGHQWGWADAFKQKGEELGAWRVTYADLRFEAGEPRISRIRHVNPPDGFTLLEASGFTADDQGFVYSYVDLSLTRGGRGLFGDIYISDLTGGSLRRLTETVRQHDENATFSPDGRMIAWNHSSGTGRSGLPGKGEEIFLMKADGSGETRLTFFSDEASSHFDPHSRQISDIGWSPDGRHLVFGHASRERHRSWDIGASVWILSFGEGSVEPPRQGVPRPPAQPATGPGGRDYRHASVTKSRHGEGGGEYWLFEPAGPRPRQAPVIVFNHGWGAMSPYSYGAWIEHLVRRGNTVIYPRYQAGALTPPGKFTEQAVAAVRDALRRLGTAGHVAPESGRFAIVGHSAGAVVSANMAALAASAGLPRPAAVMIMEPGAVVKRAGIPLEDLQAVPSSTLVLVVVGEDDKLVGDRAGKKIFAELSHLPQENSDYIVVVSDRHGDPPLVADHLAPSAASEEYERYRRGRGRRRLGKRLDDSVNALDFYGFWKLFDGLTDAAFYGRNRHYALGGTPEQRDMGRWSDGTPVTGLEVEPKK